MREVSDALDRHAQVTAEASKSLIPLADRTTGRTVLGTTALVATGACVSERTLCGMP
jgi:hypothetical protein